MATLHSTCLHGESFNIRKRKNQSKLSTTEKGIQDGRREEKSFNTRIEWYNRLQLFLFSFFFFVSPHPYSLTIRVFTRATIVKVVTPIPITACLNIIAVWLLSEGAKAFGCLEIVGAINHLNISEVTCFPKPLFRKMATSHLSWSVLTIRLRINNFTSPLYHGSTVSQIWEEERRPIPQHIVIPKLHPPVSLFWILQEQRRQLVNNSNKVHVFNEHVV